MQCTSPWPGDKPCSSSTTRPSTSQVANTWSTTRCGPNPVQPAERNWPASACTHALTGSTGSCASPLAFVSTARLGSRPCERCSSSPGVRLGQSLKSARIDTFAPGTGNSSRSSTSTPSDWLFLSFSSSVLAGCSSSRAVHAELYPAARAQRIEPLQVGSSLSTGNSATPLSSAAEVRDPARTSASRTTGQLSSLFLQSRGRGMRSTTAPATGLPDSSTMVTLWTGARGAGRAFG